MKSEHEIEDMVGQLRQAADDHFDVALSCIRKGLKKEAEEHSRMNLAMNTQIDALNWVLEREK